MQEDMRLKLPAASEPERPGVNAAAARLLAALGVEGDVDARALAALLHAHAPGSYGPDQIRRAVEDVLGDVVYEDFDWTAVEAFRRAHVPAAEQAEVRLVLEESVDALGQRNRMEVRFNPVPGKPLFIFPEQWTPKTDAAAQVAWQIKESVAVRHLLCDVAAKVDMLVGRTPEADRVMIRAVSPAHWSPDDEENTWALDPDATGHRAPFAAGDLVVRSSGRAGIHRVVAVSMDGDEEAARHRSLRLKVEPTDVVVDRDAI